MKKYLILFQVCFCIHPVIHAQIGKVGINTNTPAAMLHVKDSSVVFAGNFTLPSSPGNPPVSGSGIRMMWYADKAAFRAGRVATTFWNRDSIGQHSVAFGINTKAKGDGSIAAGQLTSAIGNFSVAMGSGTLASNIYSIAMGSNTIASGHNSTAMGRETTASGSHSMAMGEGTIASGDYSTTIGMNTIASGELSTAVGAFTKAKSYASFVVGFNNDTTSISSSSWNTLDPLFIVGNGNLGRSNAMTVLKNGNVGIGPDVTPDYRLHLTGNNGTSGGWIDGILVENIHVNPGEAVISFRNTAIPPNKHWIVGIDQTPPSLAFNYGSAFDIANTKMSLDTLGKLGIGTNLPERLLHVQNGSSGATSNNASVAVFESNGVAAINLLTPNVNASALYFGNVDHAAHGGIVYNSTTPNGLQFRVNGNSTKMVIADNGNVGIGTIAPTEKLHVVGDICYTGSIAACSDIRYKKNILPITNALNSLQSIHGIYYSWDQEKFPDKEFGDERQIGFSAQELEAIYPEMVHTDKEGYKSVDYSRLTPVLVEAIKEQQNIISTLQEILNSQHVKIELLEKDMQLIKSIVSGQNVTDELTRPAH